MIGIINYEAGNIASVSNALNTIGARFVVTDDATVLQRCNGIILPGVGAAPGAMAALKRKGLDDFLFRCDLPVLGICLGMQLLFRESEEGPIDCIGVFPGEVRKFDERRQKVPHMGWNEVRRTKDNHLLHGIQEREYFYFAHSYYVDTGEAAIATTVQAQAFASVIAKGNYYGTQFHPEKSGKAGLTILRNFESLCK